MTQDFEALLESIYEGPFEAVPWASFAARLGQRLDAPHLGLFISRIQDPGGTTMLIRTPDTEWGDLNEAGFFLRYIALDPFVGLPLSVPMALDDLLSREQLKSNEYYLRHLKPMNIAHALGMDLRLEDGLELRLRVAREHERRAFDIEDKALCRRLAPHLQRALKVFSAMQRFESLQATCSSLTEQVTGGVILLGARGEVMHANQAAWELFSSGTLKLRDGTLHLEDREIREKLSRIIETAARPQDPLAPGMVSVLRVEQCGGTAPLSLLVRVLPALVGGRGAPALMVLITRVGDRSTVPAELIAQVFGLTRTEAIVVSCLADGDTVEEIATNLGMSMHTVRAHLRSIFDKTGVSKQTELIRRVLTAVPVLTKRT